MACSAIDKVLRRRGHAPSIKISGYTYAGKMSAANSRKYGTVGKYTRNGQMYLIKQFSFQSSSVDYRYLTNEASLLGLLSAYENARSTVQIPRLAFKKIESKTITIATLFEKGVFMYSLRGKRIRHILAEILAYLSATSGRIPESEIKKLGFRSRQLAFITFPYYAFRTIIAEPTAIADILHCVALFYRYSLSLLVTKGAYGLVHRDLNVSNVIYNNSTGKITITDLECMVVGDKLYDLALIPRLYAGYLTVDDYLWLLDTLAISRRERIRLIPLIISGCMIKIATSSHAELSHKNAVTTLGTITKSLHVAIRRTTLPDVTKPLTMAERIERDIRAFIANPIEYIQVCFDPADVYISVKPYDPELTKAGKSFVRRLKKAVPGIPAQLIGSAEFDICAISNDVDVIAPCKTQKDRDTYEKQITGIYGKPVIANNRFLKWEMTEGKFKADIILGHEQGRLMRHLLHAYKLLCDETVRKAYANLKLTSHGLPFREYEKNRIYFFDVVYANYEKN